jgi:hypothetical protein
VCQPAATDLYATARARPLELSRGGGGGNVRRTAVVADRTDPNVVGRTVLGEILFRKSFFPFFPIHRYTITENGFVRHRVG